MYIVIKTVKGRRYRYAQWSWREGKKVRTKSRSLGPIGGALRAVGGLIDANRTPSHERRREGKKARSRSTYLGMTDDLLENDRKWREAQDRAYDCAMRAAEQSRKEWEAKKAAEEEKAVTAKESPADKAGQDTTHSVSEAAPADAPQSESSE